MVPVTTWLGLDCGTNQCFFLHPVFYDGVGDKFDQMLYKPSGNNAASGARGGAWTTNKGMEQTFRFPLFPVQLPKASLVFHMRRSETEGSG